MYVFITKDHDIIARGKSREQVFKRLKKSKRVRKDSTIESFTPQGEVYPEDGAIIKASKKIYKSVKGYRTLGDGSAEISSSKHFSLGSHFIKPHKSSLDFVIIFVDDEFMVISETETQVIEDWMYHIQMKELFDLSDDLF